MKVARNEEIVFSGGMIMTSQFHKEIYRLPRAEQAIRIENVNVEEMKT